MFNCYLFEKNLQGDIVGIYNTSGTKLATYTYDAWGVMTISITSGITTTDRIAATLNPFRYRGYYFDAETGFYYLNSRYYNPNWGRFINSDSNFNGTGYLTGFNGYMYATNNPIVFKDSSGNWIETALDVIGLVWSIHDMITEPSWENAGWLALDVVCLVLPVVTGSYALKAASKAAKAVNAVDTVHDVKKATDAALDTIKAASKILDKGDNVVYIARNADNIIDYVGITNDFNRRKNEWRRYGRFIEPFIDDGLSRTGARIVEQTVIDTFGMQKMGGRLTNAINSISRANSKYSKVLDFMKYIK